jgi:signal transduction histidine kinase
VRRSGFEPVSLAQIASDVVDLYEPVAEEKGVKLALVPAATPAPASIPGDPSLLFEAIANLVDNSIKFTPAGGHIEVLPLNRSDGSGIGVADTGPGIEESERAAVMKRFHRGEKSRHLPGNGLGLSLVAAVARLHGMQVSIENRRPGCVFTLWRPRSELTRLPG